MRPLKILLLNIPNENEIIGNDLELTRKHGGFYPPLGLLYIASYLKETTKHNINILDCQPLAIDYKTLKDYLTAHKYDFIGITCFTLCLVDVKKTIKLIKETQPWCKIICGGPHATIYPQETIALGADKVIVGEGEYIIKEALEKSDKIYRQDCKLNSLDLLPFPLRTNVESYYSILSSNLTSSMITSRGCPFNCNFCGRIVMGKKFRTRSANNTVDEMEECLRLGIKEINIYDDTFTVNKERVMAICDEIEKRNLRFEWDIRARVDTVDYEMLKRCRRAGCIRIRMGVESGVQRILDILNKQITLEQVERAYKWAHDLGMQSFSYFMIGNPEETKEDIWQTYKFAKKIAANFAQFTILCPFPLTKIYYMWLEKHDRDVWKEFSLNPNINFAPPIWDTILSKEELVKMLSKIYKAYYFHPKRIWDKVRGVRSLAQLKRYINAGRDLLK